MQVSNIYFSPTGKTKEVIDSLTSAWEIKQYIDLSEHVSQRPPKIPSPVFSEEDICVIAAPTFGGRIPTIVLQRLASIKAHGAIAIVVATYGNREFEDALLELKDHAQRCGFHVIAGIAAVTEHSIVREYGRGRPDTHDKHTLASFAVCIEESISTAVKPQDLPEANIPGNLPYKDYPGVSFKPQASESCIACGLCARACPVNAIFTADKDEVRQTGAACITCMRCVMYCPQKARNLPTEVLAMVTEQPVEKI